ncbi:MAG: hypothetical protein Q6K99_03385 [Thermostichales cyanobacterium BF4_bins_65]
MWRQGLGRVVWLLSSGAAAVLWAGVALASEVASLYQQLEVAVAQQNWPVALEIVQILQVLQPERALELQQYRQRLQVLAGSPTQLPLEQQNQSIPSTPENLAARVFIQNAKGRVKSTRAVRFENLEITYPETYQIDFTFQSPPGPAQQIPVLISVSGSRGVSFKRHIQLGTPRSGEIQVEFTVRDEPRPTAVKVEVIGGPARTFPLNLPSSSTEIARRYVN